MNNPSHTVEDNLIEVKGRSNLLINAKHISHIETVRDDDEFCVDIYYNDSSPRDTLYYDSRKKLNQFISDTKKAMKDTITVTLKSNL